MEKLTIETGEREYSLNDKCTVVFSPSDPKFADRLYTAFETLKKKQEAKDIDVDKLSTRERFDYLNELDKEMRETIDSVFQQPVCAELFSGVSVYAIAGGAPIWMNLIFAVMDKLDESIKREKALHSEKLEKYTKKYRR